MVEIIHEGLDGSEVEITESMRLAQQEAEAEAERIQSEEIVETSDELIIPTLLKFSDTSLDGLRKETTLIKERGQQLDLLLLKAESYSHFIRENQKRTTERLEILSASSPIVEDGKKRKGSSSSSGKGSKRIRGEKGARPSPPSVIKTDTLSYTQPANLTGGKLMDYQLDGLKWLISLWENGLSGILADEMGLGKTIQVIALVAHLRHLNLPGPFLIAAPLATIPNWVNEFKKWLPSCNVLMYHGVKERRLELRQHMNVAHAKNMDFPIIITSFEMLIMDRHHFSLFDWQYIILDEGHRIKNRNCRLVKELKRVRATNRLLLTGTPIQNTLEELWSLLNFVNPAIFDDLDIFQSWFGFRAIGKKTKVDDIISNEQQEQVVSKLHEILRPFLLRRMKQDVLISMPPKVEIVVYCGLSMVQQVYYVKALEDRLCDALQDMQIEGGENFKLKFRLMQLRKVCSHPFIFGEPRSEKTGGYIGVENPQLLIATSGKFKLLDKLLTRLYSENHKVLIFSQMTKLLDILQDYLEHKQYKYCRLDGDSKLSDRQAGIDRFNKNPDVFVFMLSTRAGGLGINLTAADTVILFDSDWNPQQDAQAMDRCHRVGQVRPVVVYRLISMGTVEVDMLEKQISKKKLERLTIHGGDFREAGRRSGNKLTLGVLRELLADDVKNLSKRLKDEGPSTTDISDAEFEMICDRDRIFGTNGAERIATEGDMYDVVTAAGGGFLQEVK